MSEIYRTWSLPEAVLALEHAERRAHAQLVRLLAGEQLASASVWARKAGEAFADYCAALSDRARGRITRAPAKLASGPDIVRALSALGVPRAA